MISAKVDPPNYNFTLEKLEPFFPNSSFSKLKKKYPKPEIINDRGNIKLFKIYIKQVRYNFPIYLQVYNDTIIEFYTRLPHYFLHNIFHQSLINKLGKQNEYNKIENAAVYIWSNVKNTKFTYSGTCTITCFPMYLTGKIVTPPNGLRGFETILEKLSIRNFN